MTFRVRVMDFRPQFVQTEQIWNESTLLQLREDSGHFNDVWPKRRTR